MDFSLSDEHKLFRSTIREFVDNEIRPVARDWERSGRYPTEIVDAMKELGLFGLTVPIVFWEVPKASGSSRLSLGWRSVGSTLQLDPSGSLRSHSISHWSTHASVEHSASPSPTFRRSN
jgi:hypothetical protein